MNKLKGKMRERGVTQADLARAIGITPQALNAKLNGRSSFTVPEAQKITEFLGLENPSEIFFTRVS